MIPSKILDGERESPIEGTLPEYIKLYEQCWDHEPNKRPNIQNVLNKFNQIISQYNANKVINMRMN